jgi:hypothetical protein
MALTRRYRGVGVQRLEMLIAVMLARERRAKAQTVADGCTALAAALATLPSRPLEMVADAVAALGCADVPQPVLAVHEKNNLATLIAGNLADLLADERIERDALMERDALKARRLYEEVIEGYTAQLGGQHTATLFAKSNLAVLLKNLGEHDEGRRLCEEVIEGYTAKLGGQHTDTLGAKKDLAVLLRHLGEHSAAMVPRAGSAPRPSHAQAVAPQPRKQGGCHVS